MLQFEYFVAQWNVMYFIRSYNNYMGERTITLHSLKTML